MSPCVREATVADAGTLADHRALPFYGRAGYAPRRNDLERLLDG